MSGLKILHRVVQGVPAHKWMDKLALEGQMDQVESALGYPAPRRMRPWFGTEYSQTVRVEERIYDSYLDFGKKLDKRNSDPNLIALDTQMQKLIDWQEEEIFFVDSGVPVPRWMQAVSRKKMSPEEMAEANIVGDPVDLSAQQIQENISSGKLRILYRIIQEVPKDRWAEKLEQERLSDAAEKFRGDPLPSRYRAFFSKEHSQIRINEREYDDYAEFALQVESFLEVKNAGDQAAMDAEIRRQSFFTWEREEIYIVDSDSYTPKWMAYAAGKGGC